GNSNNILMRELFPQSKQKASPFVNRFKRLQNKGFTGNAASFFLWHRPIGVSLSHNACTHLNS
ncbi:MAG: hypothetical protein LH481_13900, partial [Burkholderiales bacterium]|nr:hypothetical protein [Burkholderiales bacterium]